MKRGRDNRRGRRGSGPAVIFSPFEFRRSPFAADSHHVGRSLAILPPPRTAARGDAQLVVDQEHYHRIVREGILRAGVSLDVMTADFKAMLVPAAGSGRRAPSIVEVFRRLADKGVEIRLLHAGTPSSAALRELKKALPTGLTIRRCPRLHAKAVIVDSRAMYLGSANLTGAGLGAKADGRRNFEMGIWTESPAMIDAVVDQFNALWEGHRCESCRRKDVCPVPLEEPALGELVIPTAGRRGRRPRATSWRRR
jgi:phosphatidylserine/phosphatidylglycerophosphate/cardiolipin synthase-like enzyme